MSQDKDHTVCSGGWQKPQQQPSKWVEIDYEGVFLPEFLKRQWSCHVIWTGLGPTFMTAQQACLKTQECQCNLSLIYIGRNQNSKKKTQHELRWGPDFNFDALAFYEDF